ncbi:hypothetical protein ACFL02_05210, partial [Planctomycetota bacterium]
REFAAITSAYRYRWLKCYTYFNIDTEANVIYDYWDSSIYLEVLNVNEYRFISFGPNKKNDNGKYDDIVVSKIIEIENNERMGKIN